MEPKCTRVGQKKLCRQVSCDNGCEAKRIPLEVAALFDADANESYIDILTYSFASNKRFWWKCARGHSFEVDIANRVDKRGCKECNKRVDGFLHVDDIEMSCANNPAQVKAWSNINTLTPDLVYQNSKNKYYYNCRKCGHLYHTRPIRMKKGLTSCKYCGKKLCGSLDCTICLAKSAASHDYMRAQWSKKNKLEAHEVRLHVTGKRFLFDCDKCGHAFKCSPAHIFNGTRCSYCKHRTLCGEESCTTCTEKSFKSYEMSKNWCYEKNEGATPLQVFKNSHKKFFFNCDDCLGTFDMALNSMVRYNSWCRCTLNRTEQILYKWLQSEYGEDSVTREATFPWTRTENGGCRRFDFEIHGLGKNILVECDGEQRYTQIKGVRGTWKSPKESLKIDKWKESNALKNGWFVVRMCQRTILHNRMDWKSMISDCIAKIKHTESSPKVFRMGYMYEFELPHLLTS